MRRRDDHVVIGSVDGKVYVHCVYRQFVQTGADPFVEHDRSGAGNRGSSAWSDRDIGPARVSDRQAGYR